MGRQPQLLAPSEARVTVVAAHPKQPVVATGYADGAVLLVRTEDGALIAARAAYGAPVSALGWDGTGQVLAFGTESGRRRCADPLGSGPAAAAMCAMEWTAAFGSAGYRG